MTIYPADGMSQPASHSQQYRPQHPLSPITSFSVELEPDWSIYVEESGNPQGIPVVFVHGGPGSKFKETDHQWFNPKKYRIILFQQRGTHNCTPSARDLETPASIFKDVTINTLAKDLEILRNKLGVEEWLVFGGSWGSTLGLYYAQQYPQSCTGLILRGIFLSNEQEMEEFFTKEKIDEKVAQWNHTALTRLYEYAETQGMKPTAKTMCETYRTLILEKNDPLAARIWRAFEKYMDDTSDQEQLSRVLKDDLETNSDEWSTGIWETQLIHHIVQEKIDLMENERLSTLTHLPIKIVQGKQDTVCPPHIANELLDKMTTAGCSVDFSMIEGGSHSPYSHPGMIDALVRATDYFSLNKEFST
jgi:proline iminopeptidase